jgi:hypothetical protein
VIVNPTTAQGWLEPVAMDSARARLVEALLERDPYRRLRLYHPFTAQGQPIYVHAKVTVVDRDVLRVGSSNFNNRSLRLDTECDVVIDATSSGRAEDGEAVAAIRNALLAEHLGCEPGAIASMLARTGSLIETVERLRGKGRSLRPYEVEDLDGVKAWLADNKILDPEGPARCSSRCPAASLCSNGCARICGARTAACQNRGPCWPWAARWWQPCWRLPCPESATDRGFQPARTCEAEATALFRPADLA